MNDKPTKNISEVRADKHIGAQLTNEEFREQLAEIHRKHCEDYKKYLEANGYRVVKI